MEKYIKNKPDGTKEVVEAGLSGNYWTIIHEDGDTTYLTDPKFRKRYVNEDGTPLPAPKPPKKEKSPEKKEKAKKEYRTRDDNNTKRTRRVNRK
jgi:hypothetical protein